jgi:catechol 2,3-dioxygenase-like lactoylglutathione lyase family enzyme
MLVNHVGISVTDVEKSIAFYRDGLGLTLFLDQMVSGPDVDLHCNVKDGKFRMVLLVDAAGNAVELWGWENPKPRVKPPEHDQFNSVGIMEVGLLVDDLEAAEKRLNEKGYSFRDPLWVFGKGQDWFGGAYAKIRYVLDPDGVQVEVIQMVSQVAP